MNGLEALNEMYKLLAIHNIADDECYLTIENDLKLLNLLKEKKVDIEWIRTLMIVHPEYDISVLWREYRYSCLNDQELTLEEMQLIVDWLKE